VFSHLIFSSFPDPPSTNQGTPKVTNILSFL